MQNKVLWKEFQVHRTCHLWPLTWLNWGTRRTIQNQSLVWFCWFFWGSLWRWIRESPSHHDLLYVQNLRVHPRVTVVPTSSLNLNGDRQREKCKWRENIERKSQAFGQLPLLRSDGFYCMRWKFICFVFLFIELAIIHRAENTNFTAHLKQRCKQKLQCMSVHLWAR